LASQYVLHCDQPNRCRVLLSPAFVHSTLPLHDALPISGVDHFLNDHGHRQASIRNIVLEPVDNRARGKQRRPAQYSECWLVDGRSEEHTSELQSRFDLVCRLLLAIKKMLFLSYTHLFTV